MMTSIYKKLEISTIRKLYYFIICVNFLAARKGRYKKELEG